MNLMRGIDPKKIAASLWSRAEGLYDDPSLQSMPYQEKICIQNERIDSKNIKQLL